MINFKKFLAMDALTDTGLRIIYTGRDEQQINDAVQSGFYPLMKKVTPSPEIFTKYSVFQHKDTGKVLVSGDFRIHPDSNWKQVIP
ncbi:hypothetical protein [Algoriphagus chordae]|uniref:Uncharacterized protein n=1 Tax=Algoriphagus chordae TaxID=237019 RepID=A0A2W7RX87_9BACT|nr:hypothetical protein [Algoriphagus chordae]PZX55535.1 hypothetical protein LV85_00759 [Algoriphagus chordae]